SGSSSRMGTGAGRLASSAAPAERLPMVPRRAVRLVLASAGQAFPRYRLCRTPLRGCPFPPGPERPGFHGRFEMKLRVAVAAALTLVVVAGGCTGPGQPAPDGAAATSFPSVLPTRTPPPDAALDGASQPSPDPVYPEFGNPAIDVLHYQLGLDWKPDARLLNGTATLSIRGVRPVSGSTLDLPSGLAVSQAYLDGASVTVTRPGNHVTLPASRSLPAGAEITATIRYAGTPTQTPFPGSRSDVDGNGAHIGPGGELW